MADDRPSYGGGGWKRWIWIYLIAAVIIYGIVYYVFIRDGGGDAGNGSSGYLTLVPLLAARPFRR